jgi:transposase-like protein
MGLGGRVIEDSSRKSTERGLTVLRDLTVRGWFSPALAIGNGARGFWTTGREVWLEAREPRGGVHWVAKGRDTLQTEAKWAWYEKR